MGSKQISQLISHANKGIKRFPLPYTFSQNFAVLPTLEFSCSAAGYSPAVEQAEPWHVVGSSPGPGFQVQ